MDCDVVVLAGDIHTRGRGVGWALESFPDVPILYVPGNHEGYGSHWENNLAKMKAAAEGTRLRLMDRTEVVLDGVRFLGATCWTDFSAWPDRLLAMREANPDRRSGLPCSNDYRKIRTAGYRSLTPSDTARMASQARSWFLARLAENFDGPTVCVSHHPPSLKSLPFGVREPLDATEANDWDDLVENPAVSLWLHGHVHHRQRYRLGSADVVTNPRGYPGERTGFVPDFVVDL